MPYYNAPFEAAAPECRQTFNSKRLAGVEWEFNHSVTETHINTWCGKWRGTRKTDGSCGYEMMTAPMAGDHIPKCLQELGEAFQNDKATISKNCGLHVHVNCIDFSWEDIYRLMWVYGQLEDVLFDLGGEWRKRCSWAPPIGAKYREIVRHRFISNSLPPPDAQALQRSVYNVASRYALNLYPWLYAKQTNSSIKTTVEFRIHEFTSDAQRVIGWTQLMVEIVDWVKNSDDDRVKRLPKNAVWALCKMAPQSRKWVIKQLRALKASKAPVSPPPNPLIPQTLPISQSPQPLITQSPPTPQSPPPLSINL